MKKMLKEIENLKECWLR